MTAEKNLNAYIIYNYYTFIVYGFEIIYCRKDFSKVFLETCCHKYTLLYREQHTSRKPYYDLQRKGL